MASSSAAEFDRWRQRLERERRSRAESESIAEKALRDFYRQQAEAELLRAIAVAANESSTIEEALQICLERVCGHVRWPVGHAYLLDPPRGVLVPTGIWHL